MIGFIGFTAFTNDLKMHFLFTKLYLRKQFVYLLNLIVCFSIYKYVYTFFINLFVTYEHAYKT